MGFRNHEAGTSFVRTATSLGMSIIKWVVKCWVMRTHQWYQSCFITLGRFQLFLASASSEMYTYFPVPIFPTKLCLCILTLLALTRLFLYSLWIIFFSQFSHLGLLNCWCTLFLDCWDVAGIVAHYSNSKCEHNAREILVPVSYLVSSSHDVRLRSMMSERQ
jgi:hypothetical protein